MGAEMPLRGARFPVETLGTGVSRTHLASAGHRVAAGEQGRENRPSKLRQGPLLLRIGAARPLRWPYGGCIKGVRRSELEGTRG
jgi:hypothetical protein